jgi:transposase-like protein
VAWRARPLGGYPDVLLDARHERGREAGQRVDCAVLVAVGITETGHGRVAGAVGAQGTGVPSSMICSSAA